MRGFSKMMLVVLALAFSVSLANGTDPRKPDLTKRQGDISDKRVPMKMQEMKMNDQFIDKRFPVKEWHGKFSPLGNKRSSIDVRETKEKNILRPPVIEMEKKERKMAPMSGRRAYVRNFERVHENHLTPRYRDALVVTVGQASVPAPTKQQGKEPSMRDINRFSFQRNHSGEGGLKVDKAGSEEKK